MAMIFPSVFCYILLVYIMLDLKPQCANPFGQWALLLYNVYDYMIMACKRAYGSFRLMVKLSNWFSCKIKSWRDFNWLVAVCVHVCAFITMPSSNGNIFRVTGPLWGGFTGEFPAQRPMTWSFDVFFDLRLNKRLSKQSWGWWFGDFYNVTVMINTLRLRQNCHSFTGEIVRCIFVNENIWISLKRFHWSLLLGLELIIFQHWFR